MREDSRKRILEVAREHFLRGSYEGATLREISQAAQVTTGSLYHHFSGKDELFVEVCVEGMRNLLRRLRTAAQLSEGRPVTERLIGIFDAYAAFFIEERGYYELIERLETGRDKLAISAELTKRVESVLAEILEELSGIMRQERPGLAKGEAQRNTLFLVALAEGLFACERRGLLKRFGLTLGSFRSTAILPIERLLATE